MLEIKNLNKEQRRRVLIDLLFVKGFQRLEISKISDYESPKEIHNDCIENLNLPVRMTRLGIDAITYRYYKYMEEHPNVKKEMYHDIVEKSSKPGKSAISSKDFYKKYNMSHYHCHMILSKDILSQYRDNDYQELKDINKLINDSTSMHKIIEISDVLQNKRITLNELCQAHDINFKDYRYLLKQYHLTQTVYSLNDDDYDSFIELQANVIKNHPDFNHQINKLLSGQILLDESAFYFLYNYNDFIEILIYLYDKNFVDHLKELKKAVTYSHSMQFYHINDDVKNQISNINNKPYKKSGTRDLSIENKINNIIMKDPVLKMVFKDYLSLEYNERIKQIYQLIKYDARDAYKLYKEKMGKCDVYPHGHIAKLLTHDFRKKYIYLLDEMNLIKIDYRRLAYSQLERDFIKCFYDILDDNEYIINDRQVLRNNSRDFYEIDFYFPNQKLGFELSPCATHNSNQHRVKHFHDVTKSEKYHYNKFKRAEERGIQLIQLFGYDLVSPIFENITEPRIRAMFNLYDVVIGAREVEINDVTHHKKKTKELRDFIRSNHSDGVADASYKYEVKYNNKIVAGFLFKKHNNNTIEIKRFCVDPHYKIQGLISKMIKRFFIDYPKFNKVITYSDNAFGNGQSYQKSGFTYLGETGPSLKFVNPAHQLDRYSWQITMNLNSDQAVVNQDRIKKGLKPYYEEKFNVRKYIETELSHRQDNSKGYDAIYTPGSKKWEINREDVIK